MLPSQSSDSAHEKKEDTWTNKEDPPTLHLPNGERSGSGSEGTPRASISTPYAVTEPNDAIPRIKQPPKLPQQSQDQYASPPLFQNSAYLPETDTRKQLELKALKRQHHDTAPVSRSSSSGSTESSEPSVHHWQGGSNEGGSNPYITDTDSDSSSSSSDSGLRVTRVQGSPSLQPAPTPRDEFDSVSPMSRAGSTPGRSPSSSISPNPVRKSGRRFSRKLASSGRLPSPSLRSPLSRGSLGSRNASVSPASPRKLGSPPSGSGRSPALPRQLDRSRSLSSVSQSPGSLVSPPPLRRYSNRNRERSSTAPGEEADQGHPQHSLESLRDVGRSRSSSDLSPGRPLQYIPSSSEESGTRRLRKTKSSRRLKRTSSRKGLRSPHNISVTSSSPKHDAVSGTPTGSEASSEGGSRSVESSYRRHSSDWEESQAGSPFNGAALSPSGISPLSSPSSGPSPNAERTLSGAQKSAGNSPNTSSTIASPVDKTGPLRAHRSTLSRTSLASPTSPLSDVVEGDEYELSPSGALGEYDSTSSVLNDTGLTWLSEQDDEERRRLSKVGKARRIGAGLKALEGPSTQPEKKLSSDVHAKAEELENAEWKSAEFRHPAAILAGSPRGDNSGFWTMTMNIKPKGWGGVSPRQLHLVENPIQHSLGDIEQDEEQIDKLAGKLDIEFKGQKEEVIWEESVTDEPTEEEAEESVLADPLSPQKAKKGSHLSISVPASDSAPRLVPAAKTDVHGDQKRFDGFGTPSGIEFSETPPHDGDENRGIPNRARSLPHHTLTSAVRGEPAAATPQHQHQTLSPDFSEDEASESGEGFDSSYDTDDISESDSDSNSGSGSGTLNTGTPIHSPSLGPEAAGARQLTPASHGPGTSKARRVKRTHEYNKARSPLQPQSSLGPPTSGDAPGSGTGDPLVRDLARLQKAVYAIEHGPGRRLGRRGQLMTQDISKLSEQYSKKPLPRTPRRSPPLKSDRPRKGKILRSRSRSSRTPKSSPGPRRSVRDRYREFKAQKSAEKKEAEVERAAAEEKELKRQASLPRVELVIHAEDKGLARGLEGDMDVNVSTRGNRGAAAPSIRPAEEGLSNSSIESLEATSEPTPKPAEGQPAKARFSPLPKVQVGRRDTWSSVPKNLNPSKSVAENRRVSDFGTSTPTQLKAQTAKAAAPSRRLFFPEEETMLRSQPVAELASGTQTDSDTSSYCSVDLWNGSDDEDAGAKGEAGGAGKGNVRHRRRLTSARKSLEAAADHFEAASALQRYLSEEQPGSSSGSETKEAVAEEGGVISPPVPPQSPGFDTGPLAVWGSDPGSSPEPVDSLGNSATLGRSRDSEGLASIGLEDDTSLDDAQRIENLRRRCTKGMGEKDFAYVYAALRSMDSDDTTDDEGV